MDLRYLNNGRYSFVAIAHLTHDNEIDHSYIGWVFSEDTNANYFHNNI